MPRSFDYPFRFRWAFLAFQLQFALFPFFLSFFPPSLPPGKEKVGSTEAGEMIDDEFGEAKLGSWNPYLSLPLTTCNEGLEGKKKKTPSLPLVGHIVPKHVSMDGLKLTSFVGETVFIVACLTFPLQIHLFTHSPPPATPPFI